MVTTPYAITSTAPGAHQLRGNLRTSATATRPPMAAVTAPMPAPLTTSTAQSGQAWVDSPTSSARWRIQARIGSPTTTSSKRDPRSHGGASEQRSRLEAAEQAPRRAPDEHPERADSNAQPGEPEHPLEAAKILGPFELKGREVLCYVDRGGLDQAAAWPEQESRGSRGGHRHRDRKRQPRTPHHSTL